MKEEWLIYSSLVVALIIMRIPYIGRVVRVLNTMVHESGHALAALLTSGQVTKVELFADLSGTTHTVNSGKLASVVVGLAGYLFASGFAWVSALLVANGLERWLVVVLLALALMNLVLYVRNMYGMVWLVLFVFACGFLLSKGDRLWLQVTAVVFLVVMLSDSAMSAIELLLMSFKTPKKAGDASMLAKATGIPAQVFAVVFAGAALWIGFDAVVRFFPPLNRLF